MAEPRNPDDDSSSSVAEPDVGLSSSTVEPGKNIQDSSQPAQKSLHDQTQTLVKEIADKNTKTLKFDRAIKDLKPASSRVCFPVQTITVFLTQHCTGWWINLMTTKVLAEGPSA